MCNPYGYGFNDTESGFDLLNEFARVLINKGMVIVLSTHTNSYAMPKRVLRRIDEFNTVSSTVKFNCQIHDIDCSLSYPNYKFFHVNGITETSPTNQILLTCLK